MIKIVLKFLKIMIQKDLQIDYYVLGLWFTIDTFLYEEGFWINYITCSTEQPTISTVIDFIGTFNFFGYNPDLLSSNMMKHVYIFMMEIKREWG